MEDNSVFRSERSIFHIFVLRVNRAPLSSERSGDLRAVEQRINRLHSSELVAGVSFLAACTVPPVPLCDLFSTLSLSLSLPETK